MYELFIFLAGFALGALWHLAVEYFTERATKMATIHDLKKSILELPDEEAFELIKEVRFKRRQAPKKAKKGTPKRSPRKLDIKSMVQTMSEEQRQKLISELED
jgi:hypothetical protein